MERVRGSPRDSPSQPLSEERGSHSEQLATVPAMHGAISRFRREHPVMSQSKFRVALLMSRMTRRGSIVFSTLILGAGLALAAPGNLDTDFGDDGLVMAADRRVGRTTAIAVLAADRRQACAGGHRQRRSRPIDDDFIVVRDCLQDGTLDPTFSTNGIAVADLAGCVDDWAFAAVQQPDGKLVLAGYAFTVQSESSIIALARFNTDGTLGYELWRRRLGHGRPGR